MHQLLQPETNPFIRDCVKHLTNYVGVRIAAVFRDMCYGVAFPTDDTKVYELFSHEGDDMGKYSTHEINMTIFAMRRYLNIRVGKCESSRHPRCRPGFTFAWSAWFDWPRTYTRVPVTLYSLAPVQTVENTPGDPEPQVSTGNDFLLGVHELYG